MRSDSEDLLPQPVPKSDWWFVGFDETAYWNFEHDSLVHGDKHYVRRIICVYAVNRAEHTHCCELTPSHWLVAVANEIDFDEGKNPKDYLRERVRDFVLSVPLAESDHYRHVRAVERYIANNPKLAYQVGELDPEDYPNEEEQLDKLRDIWNSNPKF